MKIAIYGAGKCGEYVAQEIMAYANSKIEVTIFIDNNPLYYKKLKFNVPIISLECFMNFYREKVEYVLIAVADIFVAQEMAVSLLNENYNNIYLLSEEVFGAKLPILDLEGDLETYIRHIRISKPVLPYVEYHVSDYCNLKCKGCGHFSNLVQKKEFPDINAFKLELEGLRKRFRNIKTFRLMGGEPFINPNLAEYIYELKKAFPYTDIRIVSNGILVTQMSDQTIKAIRTCNVTIDISQYPATRNVIKKIIDFAWEKDLKIQVGEEKNKFFKGLNSGESTNYEEIYSNCVNNHCHFLRKGRIFPCPLVILLFENKDFFEKNIMYEDVLQNSFDLIEGIEDGWEIMKVFMRPFSFCKHCTKPECFNWAISGKKVHKEDWITQI